MLVKKGYKFRIYPTKKQIELINKTIGCSLFVFNYALAGQKKQEMVNNDQLPTNEWTSSVFSKNKAKTDIPKLKKYYTWLKEVDSIALQSAKSCEVEEYIMNATIRRNPSAKHFVSICLTSIFIRTYLHLLPNTIF